ncbi:MAG: hypothetical protein IPH55_17035 [Betaproteobacteria bacterium]|nr:hypothetical protein [Betaproteobacteria bacterium]
MTVGELLETIGSSEIAEWMAFAGMEPFGAEVADLRAGLMPALTVNMNRAEGADTISPFEFFPWHEKPAPAKPVELSPEETAARIKAMLGAKE